MSLLVDGAATRARTADTTLIVRMQCGFVVDRDLFAWFDVAQGDEENVIVENLHKCVRHARVVDVVSAVAATTPVQTPATIHLTDPQHFPVRTATSFGVCDLLAGVLRDLVSSLEWKRGEAASAVDRRRFDSQAGGKLQRHQRLVTSF